MARSSKPPQRRSANLAPDKMKTVIARLQARVDELKAVDPNSITDGKAPEIQELEARIKSTLSQVFGEDTHEYWRLRPATHLDHTTYTLSIFGHGPGTSVQEIRDGVAKGIASAIALLQAEIDAMREIGTLCWHRSHHSQNELVLSCSWPSVGTGPSERFMTRPQRYAEWRCSHVSACTIASCNRFSAGVIVSRTWN